MGGHGSALSIAKLYDLLANDLKFDNKKIISRQNFRDILNQSNFRIDESGVFADMYCSGKQKIVGAINFGGRYLPASNHRS